MKILKLIPAAALAAAVIIGISACAEAADQNQQQNPNMAQQALDATAIIEYDGTSALPLHQHQAVIVDFYATWCGPCKSYSPVFKEVAKKYRNKAKFIRVDVDKYPNLATKYRVQSVPTTVFFRADGTYSYVVGYITADKLSSLVDNAIAGKK